MQTERNDKMEIVINKCFGGFGLSNKAVKRYYELKGQEVWFYKQTKYKFKDGCDEYIKVDYNDENWFIYVCSKDFGDKIREDIQEYFLYPEGKIERNDTILIQVVKELAQEANGRCSDLKIVEIPNDVEWEIEEYDGKEWVSEKHRTWD